MAAAERLIWAERELLGERALRRGYEAECRRLIFANRVLRAELEATLPRSAGAPEGGLRQSLSCVGRTPLSSTHSGILRVDEGHSNGRRR